MKTLIVLAVVIVGLAVYFGPPDGTRPSTSNTMPAIVHAAAEQSYLDAIEAHNTKDGAVSYDDNMEKEYISWGRTICTKLDEGKEYSVAVTYSPGWPQDVFGRAAVMFLCPKHIGELP